jgi:NAD-reducing hydrogenase small subunit
MNNGKVKVATVWLDGCSGCHMSFLDLDELLLTVVEKVAIVYGPLVDAQEYPEDVDVCLVEGAVSSQDDLKLVQKIRQRTRILVALGDCAVTSNVPSMRNWVPVKKLLERGYIENASETLQIPKTGVPPLLKYASPVSAVVQVDAHIPGCPPPAAAIGKAVLDLVAGHQPQIAGMVKFG